MQITFQGFAPCERTLTVSETELADLNDLVRKEFLEHIQFANFTGTYITETGRAILAFCTRHGVDGTYAPDRLAFFKALLGE